jgi:hypothetical protein
VLKVKCECSAFKGKNSDNARYPLDVPVLHVSSAPVLFSTFSKRSLTSVAFCSAFFMM